MSKSTRAMRIIAAILAMLFIFSAFPIMVSAEGEYISIKNETDLKNIKNDMTAKYRLDADIEISSAWTEPIGGTAAFEGELEGNGKTISKFNLVFNSTGTTAYAGLFSTVSGIVKNLKISGEITATNTSNSSATLYVGSIAGSCGIFGSIESCQSSVEIVAKLAPTAASGSFFGAYTGKLYVGGICGYYGGWFTLGECANKAAITANCIPVAASGKTANATVYVGGIAGYAGTIENCYNSKSITGKATTTSGSATSYVGGIVGQGNTIRTSYSNGGKITGTAANNNYVGGAAGELYSATSCYFLRDSATVGIGKATNTETPATASGLTSNGMNNKKMAGFDYDNVWAASSFTPPVLILPDKLISGKVTISGTAAYAQTLTANVSEIEPVAAQENNIKFQWYRGAEINGEYTAIDGATAKTYSIKEADMGMYIRLIVKGKYFKLGSLVSGYGGSVRSAAVGKVEKLTPATPAAPTVASTTATSVTLVAVSGCEYMMARPSAGWLGTTWTEGTWQTSPTFTGLTEGTTYRFYQRIKETTTTKVSSKSAALEAKPEVHVEPVDISGSVTVSDTTPVVGQVVSANVSGITPSDIVFDYQWYRGTTAISGANASSYTVTTADYDKQLAVEITAAETGYRGSRKSALTSRVAAAVLGGTVAVNGTPTVGQTLTAVTTGLSPNNISFSYKWYRGTTLISGATGKTYTLAPADFNKTIKVVVTAGQTGYTGSKEAVTATTVAAAAISGTVSITMSGLAPTVGQTLTANTDNVNPAGATLVYQWYRGSVAIDGAKAKTYTLTPDDYNNKIKVTVTAGGTGYTGTLSSSQTLFSVAAATLGGSVSISGELAVGKTLTAQTSGITPSGINNFTYQWYRGDTKINGATTKTYTAVADDTGKILKVVVGAQQSCYTGTVAGTAVSAISAVPKVVESISVTTAPTKTLYHIGENFDSAGMVVKARYTDQSSAVIADYTVTGGTNLQLGTTYVTIEYKGFFTKANITVEASADQKIASAHYTVANGMIKYVSAGTRVYELLAKVTPASVVKAYDKNGVEMSSTALIGTGCTLRLISGGVTLDTVTVVVKGDLNGDGKVEASDARTALRAATSLETLTPAQNQAGAITDGIKPSATDARTILRVATKLQSFE